MSVNEKMTAIANEVRTLSGATDKLNLDAMASHTKDANTEVDTQENLIQQIATALQGKTAPAPSEDLDAVLAEQEELIATLQDTLRGKASGGGEVKPDPSKEYQRVASVTNDGDAYFLTDIVADNATGAELTASFTTQQDCVPMGSSTSASNTRFFVPYLLSASSIYYGFNTGTSMTFSSAKNTIYTASINFRNSRTAMLYDADGLAKVGQAVTRSVTQQTAPITILCYKTPTGRGASRKCTLYGARISQGEEVIRDYVPCYRKSDGEVGLYDMCTGTFLPNSGTDPLTKGEDVEW